MSQGTYKTLAALYQLLGAVSAEELRETSELPEVSGNVRRALIALAAEVSGSRSETQNIGTFLRNGKHLSRVQAVSNAEGAETSKRQVIINLLSNRKNFPDKASLSRFASEIGAGLEVSSKWGMPRTISALASTIERSPQVLSKVNLSNQKVDPNTKGWIDIILGR